MIQEMPGTGMLPGISFQSEKGKISLLFPCMYTMYYWEIYSIEGELFQDVERFDSELEALVRINELLD